MRADCAPVRASFVGAVAFMLLGSVAFVSVAWGSVDSSIRRSVSLPNAVAFLSRTDGVLGTGDRNSGTISLTSDGGRTWRVVRRTARPVISIIDGGYGVLEARYDDGETLRSVDRGHTWHVAILAGQPIVSNCPRGMGSAVNTQPGSQDWALCTSQSGAGNEGKEVFRLGSRGWTRVACETIDGSGCHYGGIGSYGYPEGIAAAAKGDFAIIWESRGTLYVTRTGGRHWIALPRVAPPDAFGSWASVLPHGVGFVLLNDGRIDRRRLIETTDAGRTWHVVHRWRTTA